jgi:hypothetical protein
MITYNMARFIAKNKNSLVVFGEKRTSDDKPIFTQKDMDGCDRVFYRLDGGEEFTLLFSDTQSAPDFKPVWCI